MEKDHKGWYYRKLPHLDASEVIQFITFRLADSLPISKLQLFQEELKFLERDRRDIEIAKQIEKWLDQGTGSCLLKDPIIATIVQETLLFYDEDKYNLHSWVIMPNHVHILCTIKTGNSLPLILRKWKSYTTRKAKEIVDWKGPFWQEGYFDRYIRNEEHFNRTIFYIEENPVKAGLCAEKSIWPFSSATRLP